MTPIGVYESSPFPNPPGFLMPHGDSTNPAGSLARPVTFLRQKQVRFSTVPVGKDIILPLAQRFRDIFPFNVPSLLSNPGREADSLPYRSGAFIDSTQRTCFPNQPG